MAGAVIVDDLSSQLETSATDYDSKQDDESDPKATTTNTFPSKLSKKQGIPYTELVTNAIREMKDRTGSSRAAIEKWIGINHPEIDLNKFKKKVNVTLKNGIKANRFIKFKGSFKISPAWLKDQKKLKKTTSKAAKVKVAPQKKAIIKNVLSIEALAAQKEKESREKVEKERSKKGRERLDKLRRRKFPMDDLKLIEEDRELKVKVDLPPRPPLELALPVFPVKCRSNTKGFGLMNDIMHIYHFFRGDVSWGRFNKQKSLVAPFKLTQWMECITQVSKGWSKKARMLPPLITHLFVVSLQHLVPEKLIDALSPVSWSEILFLYMDAMSTFSKDRLADEKKYVLPSEGIDGKYLFHLSNELETDSSRLETPDTSCSYFVDSTQKKAHTKLINQENWNLSVEDLLSLLKALVDDILATSKDCSEELEIRNDENNELLRRKRTADAAFKKVQIGRNRQLAEEEKKREVATVTRSAVNVTSISKATVEKAKKEQLKVTDLYEKSLRTKRIRTEPTGVDRNFQEVFISWNDPQTIFVLQKGKAIPFSLSFDVPGNSKHHRITWQSITKKSTLIKYMESLDRRGTRENNLYDSLQLVRRHIHDDIKEMNDKKALIREKGDLKRRLENAQTNYENGRKSGRLAAQSEQELIDLQNEIESLEKSIDDGNILKEYDFEVETGNKMLREFESQDEKTRGRRACRRNAPEDPGSCQKTFVEKICCSVMWPTGNIDGTGAVGILVSQLLDLEKRVDKLCGLGKKNRTAWISSLETAVHIWNELSTEFVRGTSINVSLSNTPRSNEVVEGSGSQKPTMSVYQLVCIIRQRMLELEDRIYVMTGLAMVEKETNEADDNISTGPSDEDKEDSHATWKKTINRLKRYSAKENGKIHATLIEALAYARKAQDSLLVGKLKYALMEYHPQAAGCCKDEALKVLEEHGGYDEEGDDDDDDIEDGNDYDNLPEDKPEAVQDKTVESKLSTCLCAEAIILNSSLDGNEDANRYDWISAVKKTRTVSKLASFVSAFCSKALLIVEKIESENSILKTFLAAFENNRTSTGRRKKSSKTSKNFEPSEIWTNVHFSDEFYFAKVKDYPWWPCRKCICKDDALNSKFEMLDRTVVSFVGEKGGLRMVKADDELIPFSEHFSNDENLYDQTRETRQSLDDAMATARRVVRAKKNATKCEM